MSTSDPNLQQIIKTAVASEFTSRQADLMQGVKETIASALKDNQKVLLISEQSSKDEKKSRKWLDIAQIVVPSLLTGLVAFLVWYSQNSLSNEIATTNQAVSTRYVLTQEYDKEKFKVYQRAMERLTELEGSLKGAKYGSDAKSHAIAAKNSLDIELMRTEFYFTPDMFKELNRVSYLAAQTHDINPDATGQTSAVIEQIAVVKKKIRDDVRAEMGKLSAQKP